MTSWLTYTGLLGYVQPKMHDGGFDPVFDPGPPNDDDLKKLSPDDIVFLTLGGGAGLTNDKLYDRPFISVYLCGPQGDYFAAETEANALDAILLGLEIPTLLDGARSLYIARSGGRPALLQKDSADRYHFTCSYITESTSGL